MTNGFQPHGQVDPAVADRQRAETDEEAADLCWLMGSKQGRRIVRRLLTQAGTFHSTYNTNAIAMAFAEGLRNQGVRLLAAVNAHCPDQYPVMMREADERANAGRGRNKPK